MIKTGDIISYLDMCREEGANLQKGMNFHLHGNFSVILMNLRPGAPYTDRIEENGRVLIYEGHDIPRKEGVHNPKMADQPMTNPSGTLTQNGLFYNATMKYKRREGEPEAVKVYEKIRPGIWVYNGLFKLVDAWQEIINSRKVFKFRLEMMNELLTGRTVQQNEIDYSRIIPTSVKLEVWKRDEGRCVICGSNDNLHFDHVIPYSKGGSSLVVENIQILCGKHNLDKSDKIE